MGKGVESEAQQEHAFVVIGQIGAPYGVQGWHHVRSFTQPIENILQYKQWYLQQKGKWVPFKLHAGRLHGQNIVVQLEGVQDRDVAASYTLSNIAVLRTQLASLPEDEFYWADLEGLQVKTVQGEILGTVAYLYDNANTDVMVVQKEGKEQHIPFIMHDTVVAVDLAAKTMTVDWDEAQ